MVASRLDIAFGGRFGAAIVVIIAAMAWSKICSKKVVQRRVREGVGTSRTCEESLSIDPGSDLGNSLQVLASLNYLNINHPVITERNIPVSSIIC